MGGVAHLFRNVEHLAGLREVSATPNLWIADTELHDTKQRRGGLHKCTRALKTNPCDFASTGPQQQAQGRGIARAAFCVPRMNTEGRLPRSDCTSQVGASSSPSETCGSRRWAVSTCGMARHTQTHALAEQHATSTFIRGCRACSLARSCAEVVITVVTEAAQITIVTMTTQANLG